MRTLPRLALSIVTTLILLTGTAQAGGWGLLGGAHRYSINGSSAQFSGEFGLAFHSTPFEIDALYVMKQPAENVSTNSIQVPFFYRIFLSPFFSFGVGGFVDYMIKDDVIASGGKDLDFGLAGSIRYHAPIATNTALVFDARYLMGLASLPGKSTDMGLIIGLMFH